MRSFAEYRVNTNEIIIRSAAKIFEKQLKSPEAVSYTHLRAHETN